MCIQTNVYKDSLYFYSDILGLEIKLTNNNFHDREHNTWLIAGDIMIELQTPKKDTQFNDWSSLNSGPVHLAFYVEDVEAFYSQIKQKNYTDFKIKNGQEVYEVKGSKIFKIKAPEGTEIEIRDNINID